MVKRHWSSNYKRAAKIERTTRDDITHDSAGESRRWARLCEYQRLGFIDNLERQVKLPLVLPNGNPVLTRIRMSKKTGRFVGGRIIIYKLDFRYRNIALTEYDHGQIVHEEFKGMMTKDAALKIAVVEAIYGIKITVVKKP